MNFIPHAAAQVREASWCYRSQAWSVALSNEEHWHGDMIWLATGCKLDVKKDPLLSEVMKEFPIQVVFIKTPYFRDHKAHGVKRCSHS